MAQSLSELARVALWLAPRLRVAIWTMSLCRILPISLNCAMPVIASQVAFEFAIKFSSGRSHQLTRVDVAGEAKDPPEGE